MPTIYVSSPTPTARRRLNALRALKSVPPLPFVRSVNPAEGTAGTTVALAGRGFGAARGSSLVYFGNTAAVNHLGWTDKEIRCRVPRGTSGMVNLYVVTGVGKSNAVAFKINP
ncbi:MAG: IPT/TIG domain-containing protein [Actinobacteria bacterium]|nr:IPT/TIG domain-containing protein [Actinomycetota bacterium]